MKTLLQFSWQKQTDQYDQDTLTIQAQMAVAALKRAKQAQPIMGNKQNVPSQQPSSNHQISAHQPLAPDVSFELIEFDGVPSVCCISPICQSEDVLFYIHGGGFTSGNAESSKLFGSYLAAACSLRCYTVGYRLAPTSPYPAGLDDCMTVYRSILKRHHKCRVILIGGSAGGNLCLAVAYRAREENLPMPTAMALFSPVTYIASALPSRTKNAETDIMIDQHINSSIQKHYIGNTEASDFHISPLLGDLSGFPPMLIVADSSEVLLDDAILLGVYAQLSGVETELSITSGLFHDFASLTPILPEAQEVLKKVISLVRHFSLQSD